MSDVQLTPDQEKILSEVYGYSDSIDFSEEELKIAREMFKDPANFKILRKMLGHFTNEERGMTVKSAQALVSTPITQLHEYAIETAVNTLADEKVRSGLLRFYSFLRRDIVDKKRAEFEKKNLQDFEDKKKTEAFNAEEEKKKRLFGPKL